MDVRGDWKPAGELAYYTSAREAGKLLMALSVQGLLVYHWKLEVGTPGIPHCRPHCFHSGCTSYVPTHSAQGLPFLYILANTGYF